MCNSQTAKSRLNKVTRGQRTHPRSNLGAVNPGDRPSRSASTMGAQSVKAFLIHRPLTGSSYAKNLAPCRPVLHAHPNPTPYPLRRRVAARFAPNMAGPPTLRRCWTPVPLCREDTALRLARAASPQRGSKGRGRGAAAIEREAASQLRSTVDAGVQACDLPQQRPHRGRPVPLVHGAQLRGRERRRERRPPSPLIIVEGAVDCILCPRGLM